MNSRILQIIDTGVGEPAWNMAVDEALLLAAADFGSALLRFYGWTEPAATFGYFQRLTEVESRTGLRPLIRRPTGGGIVPHDRDWTYSLTVPPGHPWYELRAVESYRTMHAWIVEAFSRLGVVTELAPCRRQDAPGQCFVGYEAFDVLWSGRKIAGAAQRRNRCGLLIQGSVQPPPIVERVPLVRAVPEAHEPLGEGSALSAPEGGHDGACPSVEPARFLGSIHGSRTARWEPEPAGPRPVPGRCARDAAQPLPAGTAGGPFMGSSGRCSWQQAITEARPAAFFDGCQALADLPEAVAHEANVLAEAKYTRAEYNAGR